MNAQCPCCSRLQIDCSGLLAAIATVAYSGGKAVNSTRWTLCEALKATGLPVAVCRSGLDAAIVEAASDGLSGTASASRVGNISGREMLPSRHESLTQKQTHSPD